MSQPLKILYACSEAAPLIKAGGLGDVSFALPGALGRLGHDVRVALPCYGAIAEAHRGQCVQSCTAQLGAQPLQAALRESRFPGTSVPVYLIEHDGYFGRPHPYSEAGRPYPDNLERFCFFCLALLDAIPRTGWMPDVVHCHDWHTAAIPAYIRTRLKTQAPWRDMPTVFTIHNLAYQGLFPASAMWQTGLGSDLFTPDYLEFYGQLNMMKAGIAFADKISTVSRRYAHEIQHPEWGHGLDGVLRRRSRDLMGIVNGCDRDVWNPSTDVCIEASFDAKDLAGKAVCKKALQTELGLPRGETPLFGMVSRLVWDKGIDLLLEALDSALAQEMQVVVLGTGAPELEMALLDRVRSNRTRVRVILDYDDALARRIYAGADFYVMPSRREPCGLSQMYGLAYGAIPIVRSTGGLADTVRNLTPETLVAGTATGLVFHEASAAALVKAMSRALDLHARPDDLRAVRVAGMTTDLSWERSGAAYVELYREAIDT